MCRENPTWGAPLIHAMANFEPHRVFFFPWGIAGRPVSTSKKIRLGLSIFERLNVVDLYVTYIQIGGFSCQAK